MRHAVNGISNVPSIETLQARLQSLAMLDAILMPEWELRYFSFNAGWMPGKMMGSMRDGEGAEFFFLFDEAGVAGKIYCPQQHSQMGILLAQIPVEFSSFVSEPAFDLSHATCFLWQHRLTRAWSVIPPEIEIPLLAFVGDQGDYYRTWAERYYERPISSVALNAVFEHHPLTIDLVSALSANADLQRIISESAEIGYPAAN